MNIMDVINIIKIIIDELYSRELKMYKNHYLKIIYLYNIE